MEDKKKEKKKLKWDKKKFEGKKKTVGKMQRGVDSYMKGSMKDVERIEIE